MNFTGVMEPLTIPIASMSPELGPKYEAYLTSRIFELLKDVRPWGINGESMKWQLMDRLTEEEIADDLPAPDFEDVERILKKYWSMDAVRGHQRKLELVSFEMSTRDEKPSKRIMTPASGILGCRTFTEVGATADILRCVGEILTESGESADAGAPKYKKMWQEKMDELPGFKDKIPQVSVASQKSERKALSHEAYLYQEDALSSDRWQWLQDKQDQLRKSDVVERLAHDLFHNQFQDMQVDDHALGFESNPGPVTAGSRSLTASKAADHAERKTTEKKEKRPADEAEQPTARKTRAKK